MFSLKSDELFLQVLNQSKPHAPPSDPQPVPKIHAQWELRMGSGSLHGSCTHGCWLGAVCGGGPVGTGTFRAPQEDTGELAAVQRALEKAHWKKD